MSGEWEVAVTEILTGFMTEICWTHLRSAKSQPDTSIVVRRVADHSLWESTAVSMARQRLFT